LLQDVVQDWCDVHEKPYWLLSGLYGHAAVAPGAASAAPDPNVSPAATSAANAPRATREIRLDTASSCVKG
jgi:hypothetical protein